MGISIGSVTMTENKPVTIKEFFEDVHMAQTWKVIADGHEYFLDSEQAYKLVSYYTK